MDSTDAVITGITLLAIVPMLFVEYPAYRTGGYTSAFWRLSLDEKLDHIATQPEHWTRLGLIWLPIPVLATAGMTAFTFQLVAAGGGVWGPLGMGAFLVGTLAWLFGVLMQTTVVRTAASVRAGSGSTPDWLQGFWDGAFWAEMTFVLSANAAAVLWGIGMLDTGYPADWMGWVAILIGALAFLTVAFTREGFPHLGVFVPVVLGVALVIY